MFRQDVGKILKSSTFIVQALHEQISDASQRQLPLHEVRLTVRNVESTRARSQHSSDSAWTSSGGSHCEPYIVISIVPYRYIGSEVCSLWAFQITVNGKA